MKINLRKTLFIFCGFLGLFLGIVGIFLPIMPTTPFLLLSAWFFSKSSLRFYHWLLNLPTVGPIIKNWQETKSIPVKAKFMCVFILSAVMGYLLFLKSYSFTVKSVIFFTLVLVISFIITRPSKTKKI